MMQIFSSFHIAEQYKQVESITFFPQIFFLHLGCIILTSKLGQLGEGAFKLICYSD